MSILPTRRAIASTAALSRTSSRATSDPPSLASSARPFSSMSVANTVAPSRAKAMAQARPMPIAPAVTKARLPFNRSDIQISSEFMWVETTCFIIRSNAASFPPHSGLLRKVYHRARVRAQRRRKFIICGHALMVMPRGADNAGDVVIPRREFQTGPGGRLADGRAIEFLPRRLMRGIGEAALGLEFGATALQFI